MVGWEGWILDTFSAYSSILIFWTLNFLFSMPDPCVHISTSTYLGYPDCLRAIFLSLDNWIFLHQTERTPNYIFIMLRKFTLSGKPVGLGFYIKLSNSKCATSKEYSVIKRIPCLHSRICIQSEKITENASKFTQQMEILLIAVVWNVLASCCLNLKFLLQALLSLLLEACKNQPKRVFVLHTCTTVAIMRFYYIFEAQTVHVCRCTIS